MYIEHLNKCIDQCEKEIAEYELALSQGIIPINGIKQLKEFLQQAKKELPELKRLKRIHLSKEDDVSSQESAH